jgi:hypothetical protein
MSTREMDKPNIFFDLKQGEDIRARFHKKRRVSALLDFRKSQNAHESCDTFVSQKLFQSNQSNQYNIISLIGMDLYWSREF